MAPALDVGLLDFFDSRFLGQIDGLGDGARDERLCGAHHLHVAQPVNRARAVLGLEGAVEHRQVLFGEVRSAFDRSGLVDVSNDCGILSFLVTEARQSTRHGVVHDLHTPAADERLVFDQGDVGLDAGRIAVHHEADRPGGRDHGGLRIAIAVLAAEGEGVFSTLPGSLLKPEAR